MADETHKHGADDGLSRGAAHLTETWSEKALGQGGQAAGQGCGGARRTRDRAGL